MYLTKFKTSLFIILAALSLFFVSCEKYDVLEDEDDETENFLGTLFDDDGDDDFSQNGDEDDFEEICFDFVFPISIDFPEGETVTFNNLDTLWTTVEDWYETAVFADSLDPIILYPIEVELSSGEVITVTDDDKLSYLLEECEYDHHNDDHNDHDDYSDCEDYVEWIADDLIDCYDVVFPIQVLVGDDSITINSIEEVDTVFAVIIEMIEADDDLDVNLVYPVTVVDLSTNLNVEIESESQLIQLAIACEVSNLCFSINYPITLVNPDGSSVDITNDTELIAAYVQFEISEAEGELIPVFPIDVTLDNGDMLTKENLEDFEALYDYCD